MNFCCRCLARCFESSSKPSFPTLVPGSTFVILNPKGEGSSKVVMRCHPALVMNLHKLNYLVFV